MLINAIEKKCMDLETYKDSWELFSSPSSGERKSACDLVLEDTQKEGGIFLSSDDCSLELKPGDPQCVGEGSSVGWRPTRGKRECGIILVLCGGKTDFFVCKKVLGKSKYN